MAERNDILLEQRAKEAVSMIFSPAIYFAHPVNYYVGSKFNTHGNKENELVEIIFRNLPYAVYNPNQLHNQENYVLWKNETGSGMNYYFDVILPHMDAGIVLPFEDGMIGAGAFGEIEKFVLSSRPAYEITESGIITPIKKLDYSRKLSIEDTQLRVYPKK